MVFLIYAYIIDNNSHNIVPNTYAQDFLHRNNNQNQFNNNTYDMVGN